MGFYQTLLLLLLVLPGAAAIVVACLGQARAMLVRQIALGVTIAGALIAVVLACGLLSERTNPGTLTTVKPIFVPGATASDPSRTTWNLIDFNMGSDAKESKRTANLGP